MPSLSPLGAHSTLNNANPGVAQPATTDDGTQIMLYERGTSGLRAFAGFVTEAYNTQLTWPTVEPLYRRLIRSTPEMVVVRQAFTTWARGTDMICDLPEDANDDDKKFQEFFYQCMNQDLEGGLDRFKETMVANVPFYGWGWWEVVPGIRSSKWVPPTVDDKSPDPWRSRFDDGLIGFRRLAFRSPSSFYRWEFDTRKHLTGMIQRDWPAFTPVAIPLNESLHMTFGDPNNPEGLSPLEAVWRLERLRFGLEVVQGIGFEHSAGYLDITKSTPGAFGATDLKNISDAARAILSAQAGNYAVWPNGVVGAVKDTPFAAAATILDAIKHYSVLMLTVYMMSFLGLNSMTNGGSRAATGDVSQLGVVNFNSMMEGFAGQFYNQAFRRLWNWNKASFPQSQGLHSIRFTEVSKDYALTELSQFITAFSGVFAVSDDDNKAVRQRSGFLPETVPDTTEEPTPPPDATDENQPPADGGAEEQPKPGEFSHRAQLAQLLMQEENHARARR